MPSGLTLTARVRASIVFPAAFHVYKCTIGVDESQGGGWERLGGCGGNLPPDTYLLHSKQLKGYTLFLFSLYARARYLILAPIGNGAAIVGMSLLLRDDVFTVAIIGSRCVSSRTP